VHLAWFVCVMGTSMGWVMMPGMPTEPEAVHM
jgi:hypothetical protein